MKNNIEATLFSIGLRICRIIFYASSISTAVAIVAKVLHAKDIDGSLGVAFLVIIAGFGLVLLPLITEMLLRFNKYVSIAAAVLAVAIVSFITPRMAQLHAMGRGTDQGDCVAVAATRLMNGLWPYSLADMRTHNPMSCGPAWFTGHAPFLEFFPYPVAMLIVIAAALVAIGYAAGLENARRVTTTLALIPGVWLSLANGNDFATFGVLAGAVAVAVVSEIRKPLSKLILVLATLSIAHARLPFILLPAIALPRRGTDFWKIALATQVAAIAIWSGYLLYNPNSFIAEGPMHVLQKAGTEISAVGFAVMIGVISLVLIILHRFVERIDPAARIVLFISLVLIPMSVLDLLTKIDNRGSLLSAFAFWEGTSWMTGVAAVAACASFLKRREPTAMNRIKVDAL